MEPFDVIGIGVNAVDVLLRMPARVPPGGKYQVNDLLLQGGGLAATATCVCAALGWRAGYVAKLGDNMLSRIACFEYEARGIRPDLFIESPAARPCIALVQIDAQTAERTIFYNLDEYEHLRPVDLPVEALQQAKLLMLDGYEPAAVEAALQIVQHTACRTVLDLESGDPDAFRRMIALGTDVILPLATARALTGYDSPDNVARTMAAMTAGQVVITDGMAGSWAVAPDGLVHQPAFQVTAVDTTGCGDVFHGAYAAGVLEGMTLQERLEFAAWLASLAACRVGGRAGIPTRRQLATLDHAQLTPVLKARVMRMSQG
jgi:sulfofructose kinase